MFNFYFEKRNRKKEKEKNSEMFDLLFIIPRELKAKKLRTGISILGISTVVMFFVFVLTGIAAMDKFIEASIQSYKGKLVVIEKGKADPPISELPEEYVETIKTIEHVKNVAPILWRFVDNSTNDKTEYLAVRGLEIETIEIVEKNFEIIEGKNLDGTETDEVIIGVDLAYLTNKKIGEKIELSGEKFSIKGIFSAGESL